MWISVKERLPEDCQRVLIVCEDDGSCYSIDLVDRATFYADDDEFVITGGPYIGVEEVTHWMPLPEPPTDYPAISCDVLS